MANPMRFRVKAKMLRRASKGRNINVRSLKPSLPYLTMKHYANTREEASNKYYRICKALESTDAFLAEGSRK